MTDVSPGYSLRYEPTAADADSVRRIVSATGFFTQEEVDIAVELVEERLAKGAASGYEFVLFDDAAGPFGYACFGKIPCTTNRFDLYWIAVDPERQGRGLGRALMREAERRVLELGGSRVYIDTSDKPQYAPTRTFYECCGYAIVAALPDFYGPRDGKAIFLKRLRED